MKYSLNENIYHPNCRCVMGDLDISYIDNEFVTEIINKPVTGKINLGKKEFQMVDRGATIKVKIGDKDYGLFKAYYRRRKDNTIFLREIKNEN